MSKGDLKSGYDQWKEYFEKRRIETGQKEPFFFEKRRIETRVKKKKEPFFFKWQRITLWILFILTSAFGIAAIGEKSVLVVCLILLGLFIKLLFWSVIGNAIYYSVQKKKKATPKIPQVGIADEIRKFKELLDDGAITQEEFDKKKRDLLG